MLEVAVSGTAAVGGQQHVGWIRDAGHRAGAGAGRHGGSQARADRHRSLSDRTASGFWFKGFWASSSSPRLSPESGYATSRLSGRDSGHGMSWPSTQMGWLLPSPDGIAVCQDGGVESH